MVIEGGLKIAFQSQSVCGGNSLLEAEKKTLFSSTVLDKMFWPLTLLCSFIDACLCCCQFLERMRGCVLCTLGGGLVEPWYDTRTIKMSTTTTTTNTPVSALYNNCLMNKWFMTSLPLSWYDLCCPVDANIGNTSITTTVFPFCTHIQYIAFLMDTWKYT